MGPFEDTLTATLMLPACDLILCLLFYYFYILTTELKCFVNVFNNIVMRLPWKVKDQSSLMGLNHNFHAKGKKVNFLTQVFYELYPYYSTNIACNKIIRTKVNCHTF